MPEFSIPFGVYGKVDGQADNGMVIAGHVLPQDILLLLEQCPQFADFVDPDGCPTPMPETLTGLIERVTYHNPENGFAVLKVQVKGRQDLVTVVGSTTSVSAGEHLEATGRWVVDREHGQQFKADEVKTTHPASAEGIEKYLASGAIRSIGPKLSAKIVGIYKERTLEILETAPDFLLHIKGIGQERLKRIRHSWEEQTRSPQDHALSDRAWDHVGAGRPHLPHLRPRSHRQDQAEPVPTGRRHPGHRIQDGR